MFSTAVFMPGGSTDSRADKAMSLDGLRYSPPEAPAAGSATCWGGGWDRGGESSSGKLQASAFFAARADACVSLGISETISKATQQKRAEWGIGKLKERIEPLFSIKFVRVLGP